MGGGEEKVLLEWLVLEIPMQKQDGNDYRSLDPKHDEKDGDGNKKEGAVKGDEVNDEAKGTRCWCLCRTIKGEEPIFPPWLAMLILMLWWVTWSFIILTYSMKIFVEEAQALADAERAAALLPGVVDANFQYAGDGISHLSAESVEKASRAAGEWLKGSVVNLLTTTGA